MKRFLYVSLIVLFLVACEEIDEAFYEELYMEEDHQLSLDNGCKIGEKYIEDEDTCIVPINCEDYESCINWSNELIASLENLYGSLVEEESVATNGRFKLISTYEIDLEAEEITTKDDVTDEELDWHANLWFSFSWLIPEAYRTNINQFEVFESGQLLAYVRVNDDDGKYWTLGMNDENIELASETLITYIHEYAHYLSLNNEEIDFFVDEKDCTALYISDMGCTKENAYLYKFYEKFWADEVEKDLENDYVSEYAMTSVEEDFAESFAHFVLTETPEGNTVMEEKLLFFYEYEELVQLRTEILSRVATWLDRSVVL